MRLGLIADMGWEDFSCFGNRDAQTLHIDRLAAGGTRFSQFYVNSPICSPSRCAARMLHGTAGLRSQVIRAQQMPIHRPPPSIAAVVEAQSCAI